MTEKAEDRPDPDAESDLVREARRRAELPAHKWEEVRSVDELTRGAREALREREATPPGERGGS